MKHKIFVLSVIFILFPITVFSGEWTSISYGTISSLNGVWGSSGSNVFAVGHGAILHYNGSSWSEELTSTSSTTYCSVGGSSGSDVFAVGSNGTILHYDGNAWSSMTNPLSGTKYGLYCVWGDSGSDVFAGGLNTILHYNGSAWSDMTSGPLIQYASISSIWGSSGNDVFAVDSYGTIILHYDGNAWSSMPNPLNGMAGIYLESVWGSSGSDVFAVGSNGTILHYDGNAWSSMTNPLSGTGRPLFGVWGSSSRDVFAVGAVGSILHYDGSTWSSMNSGTKDWLYSVWSSNDGGDVFAVGYDVLNNNGSIILRYGEAATFIDLSAFTATPKVGKVVLQWSTESEIDNSGFNLYRAMTENGDYIKINTSLIPAKGSSTQGASYEFIDTNVQNIKTYYYKLEDIDLNGNSTMHGPVSATPRLIYGIGKQKE